MLESGWSWRARSRGGACLLPVSRLGPRLSTYIPGPHGRGVMGDADSWLIQDRQVHSETCLLSPAAQRRP